jgi:hypothetical protein
VIEQIDRAGTAAIRERVERHPERIGIKRVVHEDDEIARRILGDARIAANNAKIVAAQAAFARSFEIFFADFAEAGREFDAPDLLERMLGGEDHRAPHPRSDVDERTARDRFGRHEREHCAEIVDGHGLVVRRVGARVADAFGIEIGEEEHGVRGNTVVVIEPASAAARFRHT